MKRHGANSLLASLLLAGTACDQPSSRTDQAAAPAPNQEGHADTAHGAVGAEGQALLPIMQRVGNNMMTLTHALMTDDYETVERSATAIAEHVPISTAELERVRSVLTSEMRTFEAMDESVHVASVRLRDAARERRLDLVVERLGDVQRGCVSCHTQFRQRLRADSTGR